MTDNAVLGDANFVDHHSNPSLLIFSQNWSLGTLLMSYPERKTCDRWPSAAWADSSTIRVEVRTIRFQLQTVGTQSTVDYRTDASQTEN